MKRGGVRQRLGLHKCAPKTPVRSDPLANELLDLYSDGRLSAGEVGTLAAASSSSSSSSIAPLQRLAKAKATPSATAKGKAEAKGKTGVKRKDKHSSRNSRRSLARTLEHECPLMPTYDADIVVWDSQADRKTTTTMSFLPIHEVLDAIVDKRNEEDWLAYNDDQMDIKARLGEWGDRVGVASEDLDTCLAIGLWGDSAPYAKRDSLHLLLWTVLCGTIRTRYWLCGFNKKLLCQCGCYGRCTYDCIWAVITWMFRVLLTRRFPECDHTGKPFPPGSIRAKRAANRDRLRVGGARLGKFGDWHWFKAVLNLRGWRGEGATKGVCWMCNVGFNDTHNCYNFSMGAPWRKTMFNMVDFWANAKGTYSSGIWAIPGFHLKCIRPDWMHMGCLGVLQYLIGNVLWELFKDMGGKFTNPKTTCALLENMIEVCSKSLGVAKPVNTLTVTMFRASSSEKPKFKGKAAENRHLLPVLLAILQNCVAQDSEHNRNRFHCVAALNDCYTEMEDWCPKTSPRNLGGHARRHLILWANLCAEAENSDDPLLWRLYPKHHLLLHCAEKSATNPRLELNYSDESEIGHGVKVAAKCNVNHLPTSLMRTYRSTFVV